MYRDQYGFYINSGSEMLFHVFSIVEIKKVVFSIVHEDQALGVPVCTFVCAWLVLVRLK